MTLSVSASHRPTWTSLLKFLSNILINYLILSYFSLPTSWLRGKQHSLQVTSPLSPGWSYKPITLTPLIFTCPRFWHPEQIVIESTQDIRLVREEPCDTWLQGLREPLLGQWVSAASLSHSNSRSCSSESLLDGFSFSFHWVHHIVDAWFLWLAVLCWENHHF